MNCGSLSLWWKNLLTFFVASYIFDWMRSQQTLQSWHVLLFYEFGGVLLFWSNLHCSNARRMRNFFDFNIEFKYGEIRSVTTVANRERLILTGWMTCRSQNFYMKFLSVAYQRLLASASLTAMTSGNRVCIWGWRRGRRPLAQLYRLYEFKQDLIFS